MTGLTPEQRFDNHKQGIKAARIVKRCGERLVPRLYAHLNPMPYAKARGDGSDPRREPPQARLTSSTAAIDAWSSLTANRELAEHALAMQAQLPFDADSPAVAATRPIRTPRST